MEQFKPPKALSLEGNLKENWRRWIQRFNLYLQASGAHEKPQKIQCAILLHCVGEDALEVYNNFQFSDEEKDNLEPLIAQFEAYCNPRKNTIFERYLFWERIQTEGETVDQFVTDLKTKAKSCEYGEQCENMIRDRLVFGIRDIRLKERLLRDSPDLTLQKAIEICRASEISQTQIRSMTEGGEKAVHATKPDKKGRKVSNNEIKFSCKKCGSTHEKKSCPAFGKSCRKCGKKNHFAKVCFSKVKEENSKVHTCQPEHDSNDLFIGELSKDSNENAWYSTIRVFNNLVKFKLDTGAEANVIPMNLFKKFSGETKILQNTNTVLSAYGNHKVKPQGYFVGTAEYKGLETDIPFFVADVNSPPILGLKACEKLNLIQRVNSIESSELVTKEKLLDKYSDVFNGLGHMRDKYHIELDKSVKPVIHPSRNIPVSLRGKLKETLDRLEQDDIIAKVDQPTDWVNSLVIVEKRDGSLRLCLDPRDLNRAIKREHFKIPTADDISSKLSGKKIFTILDEKDGFWHIELDEESSFLCTFNTPHGRYRFKRMPFGISSAPEVFQKKNQQIFGDIEGVEVIFDDIIIAAENEEEHDKCLLKVMERARENNVKFNKNKLQLRVKEVKYVGNVVSEDGLKIDPDKILAITGMSVPQCKADLQRFLGMINFLSKFIPNMSTITEPLRTLLKKEVPWSWNFEHTESFNKLKEILVNKPVLKFFDPLKPVKVQCDASQKGLGACLLQEDHPVAYTSRALTPAEQNYAQIEKELLAIVFACEKFHNYVYGQLVEIISDHKPLESIMVKPLAQASPRLQRMLLRLQKYNLTVKYVPGKLLHIADTLSRAYLSEEQNPVQDDSEEMEVVVHSLVKHLPMTAEKLEQFKQATGEDHVLQAVRQYVINGWPQHKRQTLPDTRHYWNIKDDIYEAEGLLFVGQKLIVPSILKSEMLKLIHESHLGIDKCKSRARVILYWPGMSRDIEEEVAKCSTCAKFKPKNVKEPLLPHEVPDRAWQKLATDIFEFNSKDYLVIVDYYSKYPEICLLRDKTAKSVIVSLKSVFARHGIPDEVMSDNVPFNSNECKNFAKSWGFKITTSSPTYPQSNGMAERNVQTVKNLLKKAHEDGRDYYVALLEFRNTPISGLKYSPAQLLMNRILKSKLPTTSQLMQPKIPVNVKSELLERQKIQKKIYDRNAKPLKPIKEGDSVRIRSGKVWEPAVVTGQHTAPRSYIVTTPDGGEYRRNRRHLLKTKEEPPSIIGPPIDHEDQEISQEIQEPKPIVSTDKRTSSGRIVRLPSRFKDFEL